MLNANMPLQGWVNNNIHFNEVYDVKEHETQSMLSVVCNIDGDYLSIRGNKLLLKLLIVNLLNENFYQQLLLHSVP